MQQADQANTRSAGGGSSGKTDKVSASRRGVLFGAIAAPMLAVPTALFAGGQDRDPILDAAARWDAHQRAFISADEDEAGNDWWNRRDYELFEETAQIPARTKQGMAAKLRMAQDYTATDWPAEIMREAQLFLEKSA